MTAIYVISAWLIITTIALLIIRRDDGILDIEGVILAIILGVLIVYNEIESFCDDSL